MTKPVCALVCAYAAIGAVMATAWADDDRLTARTDRIQALLKKHPQTFELTVMSHYSDDDFGFHVQTAPLPMDDSMFPRHRIPAARAAAIVRALAQTPFGTRAVEGKRGERFRPKKPETVKRVYGLTLRCGDRAFFEDVQSDADMAKRADSIWRSLEGTSTAAAFHSAFRSRLNR